MPTLTNRQAWDLIQAGRAYGRAENQREEEGVQLNTYAADVADLDGGIVVNIARVRQILAARRDSIQQKFDATLAVEALLKTDYEALLSLHGITDPTIAIP